MPWLRAFSTLGCAGEPLADVLGYARTGGWQGLELRAAPGEPVHVGLTPDERRDVRRLLGEAGVAPLSIASYVEIDGPGRDEGVVRALLEHVRLAADLGAPFVRVFPGGPSRDGAAARRLAAVVGALDGDEVAIAVETHDTRARGGDVRALLERVGDPRLRAIWDVQHPWRAGEAVDETFDHLQPFLAYVQITDARSLDDLTPVELGRGVLPLGDVHALLRARGYDGWISLEWASYWFPDAPPLDAALRSAERWFAGALLGPAAGSGVD